MQCVLFALQLTKYLFRIKKNMLKFFQPEVDYYSNEANKNKYTNFQLIASTKTT